MPIHPLFVERHGEAAKAELLELERLRQEDVRRSVDISDRICAQMDRCREFGVTWEEIAAVFGVSRQAVHQRYARAQRRANVGG